MTEPWRHEFQRIAGVTLIGLLLGALLENWAAGLLLPFTIYLGWHLYNLFRLVRWLRESKKFQPPESSGIWGETFDQIFRLQQRNRKRKRNLRRVLKRFHKMTVALPDAMVEFRPGSDEIEWWNHAAARYLGLEYPRDTGQRVSNLIRNPEFLAYLNENGGPGEIEMQAPANEDVTLRVVIIHYSKNRRLLVARNITRLQQLERTRQDFVANVSHELRSPLTVVSGYLETLLDDDDVDQVFSAQLHSMHSQTQRMTRIVEDLMFLSRLENDDPQHNIETVVVPEMIASIADHARELGAGSDHVISLDVDAGLAVRGHEAELYSAFSNLVFNAIRYTPAGGHITIVWRSDDEGVVFSVKDTGEGIASHHLPRLTERFYRIDTGRSRASGGTGLGLAIVKHVMLRHEGHLDIDSEPGKGSLFSCHFPSGRIEKIL